MKPLLKPLHVLRSTQFDRMFIESLFRLTDQIRVLNQSRKGLDFLASLLSHKRAMLYFTQPSTRTFLSFQSACHILGLKTSEIRNPSLSSESKGESIEDSLRTFSSYVDLIIMRSAIAGLCDKISLMLTETPRPVPVINAGSGPDEHPTQALLDLYTLHRSFRSNGGIEGKKICMVGDLKRGRTIRSLAQLLTLFDGVTVIFSSPKTFAIAPDLHQYLSRANLQFIETQEFVESIRAADAVYMTRIQDEYELTSESEYSDYSQYYLREEHLKLLKEECVILHPMPRRQELDPRIDLDHRAGYWRQERNGMWIRVALITKIFEIHNKIMSLSIKGSDELPTSPRQY